MAEEGFAEQLIKIGEQMAPVVEATSGYSARLEAAGFPVDIANQMAAHYHALLIEVIRKVVVG